jgi:hypothetical protein
MFRMRKGGIFQSGKHVSHASINLFEYLRYNLSFV